MRESFVLCALVPLTGALVGGCREQAAAPIHVVLGPAPEDEVSLVPKAALAEFVELSPTESELHVTLSSEEQGCDAPFTVNRGAVVVAINVLLPGGAKLEPGRYPLAEAIPGSDKPHALASIQLRGRRTELRPGGDIELQQLDATPQGSLEGLLKLEYAGDAEHPATRISGRFRARFCRINRLR